MPKIVVDIETIGVDFEAFEKKTQEYLFKYSETDEEREEVKKKLALSPLTGEIVTIGMLNPETRKGIVLFQNKEEEKSEFEENGIQYESGSEKAILEKFWELVKNYDQVITFNGRSFDGPFLSLRSAKHEIHPAKNLFGYRYDHKTHCDLLEQLTFYGATRRYTLDFYAKYFGIKSSKDEGTTGSMVGELYQAGKYLEIARYCARDLVTTAELYAHWDKYLRF
ncbi:MAG: ribonuclease H-like domain-containing protein [Candidatus Moranbacteria bacterium]|nr:ribonuclease H-like domain-containing protein [Candidatus Moranbacteria bacterium]